MKYLLLILGLALSACTTEPEDDTSTDISLVGRWEETLPEGVLFFAGSRLNFEIAKDGLRIEDNQWTDMIDCHPMEGVQKCSDVQWKNQYQGKLKLTGSTLVIDYTFKETTANDLTRNHVIASGQGQFKVTFIKADNSMVLEKTSTDPFIGNKTKIVLRFKKA